MSFDHPAIKRFGRRAPKSFAFRALAIGATTALVVLSFPASAFAVGAPDAPAKPTAVTGNASVTVSFVAPADNGSAITGYTVTCTSSTGGVTGANSGAASSITVSSLTNAATYTCTVHATNINGDSAESPASDALVAGAPSKPAQPTVTHGNGSISVAIVAPASNGSPIQFFTADCSSSDGGAEGIVSDTTSPVLVIGLDNGKTYTCTASASNGNGAGVGSVPSASAVPATVPGAPANPIATRGDTQISVAFVAPADNGSAITSYTATCTSSNGGTAGSHSGPSSPLVVTGLTNGKSYTCRVIATNAEGDSGQSVASSATVPATVPGAPAQPTVVHGAASISVTFAAPVSTGGSTITGYTAACASSNGGASGSGSGTVSPIVVSSLTNGKTYTCTVHATNAVGNSIESPASASTVPAAKPDAPAAPAVTRGNASISVAFVAPAANGSTITGYTAACTSSDGGTFGNHSGGTSPIVVTGLTNGKTYTCTVLATNGEGDSTPSAASSTAIPATLPGAPAQPVVTHGNALISVAFSAPGDGGNAITGYAASCVSSNGGASGSNTGATSPIVVSSLTNGKTYTCTVFATNSSGDGPASVASTTTVPATVPGTPAQPAVTHGNASISVAFTAPVSNGGSAITGYSASCTSSDGGVSGSNTGATSPIVVPTLTNGKTYTCVVHANNAEGSGSDSIASASTIPATVPSAPVQPTISAGGTTITVAFVAPATGGSAITGYSVSCTSSNGGESGSNTGASSTIDVTGLTLGKSYTCTVHATNAEGDGNDSIASAPATVPAVVPDTLAQPTVTRGAAAVSVAFVAPFNGGAAITGYTASCASSDGGASGADTGVSSPVVVGSLSNGKTYTCTVHATNSAGDSLESAASAAVVPAAVPNAPAAPAVTRGNAQISVAFVAPAANGSAITGYTASCTSSDGGTFGSNTGGSSPIVASTLTNGKSYTCAVFATNNVGDGLPSADSASTIPATTPSAPAQPTVTRANAQISVAFVAPANGGNAIIGYTASCSSSDGGADGGNTGGASPIVVSSLTNGKTYTCTVFATNSVGDGPDSAASAVSVPATVPFAPAKPTTIAAATHITVSFVAPADGGSAITGYTASCTSSDGGAAGSNSGVTSPIAVQSLSKSKTYTCTVHATNATGDSGESPASDATVVPATVPDAPAKPTATRGNGQVSVAFVAPDNGGSSITGYSVNCTSSNGGAPGAHSGGSSPIIVTGLDNGKTYTCTVLATSSVGDSDASVASDPTTPATVPGAPDAPTVTRGNSSISVAFVSPAGDGGSAITGYTASCSSSDGGTAGSHGGVSSPIVVSSLTNGKTYTCTVLATNAVGDGTASAASASAVPATVPAVPAAPTLTHGNAQISVAFVTPANGGSAITGYTASCTSSDGGVFGTNTGASSPIVVSSLTNGKTYTCTVLATNVVGDGTASAASASAVPATMPGTPAAPTITRGNATISVAFVAPASGGSAITGYTASCTSSDGGVFGTNTGTSSPIVVSSLTNAKAYTCVVHATNLEGSGPDSAASASTGPATVPTAPAQPSSVAGNSRLRVAVLAPASGNSPITGYTASCMSSDGGVAGSASAASSSILVSRLTNVKMYTCTVHATNALGSSVESVPSPSMQVGLAPTSPTPLTITGPLVQGHVLTMHGGAWGGSQPITYVHKWQRCSSSGGSCFKIPGQTGSSYRLRPADVHHTIRAVLTVTNPLGTVAIASVPTAAISW